MKALIGFLALSTLSVSFSSWASNKVITGEDETESLSQLDPQSEIYRKSSPTGRVKVPGVLGINDYCTISLISGNTAITAAHCFDSNTNFSRLTAYFEYYDRSTRNDRPYRVTRIVSRSLESDIMVLELEGNPGEIYGTYPIATDEPVVGDALVIYQHQGLAPKSVSRVNCQYGGTEGSYFFHTCDTQNYSSGSPILNSRFELVAVHQGALIQMNQTRNYGGSVR